MAWFVVPDSRNRNDENEAYVSPDIDVIQAEQERFEAMGRALGIQLFKDYRQNGRDPYDDTLALIEPFHPYWSPARFPPMLEGWRWPMPSLPFRDQLKRRENKIVDIISTGFRTYAISQRVIDIIESIEPAVHQYLPYELVNRDGEIHPERRWLLNVCTRATAIDVEKSHIVPIQGMPSYFHDKVGRCNIIVKKSETEGRALWFEYRYRSTVDSLLLSDQFWSALQSANCTGWRPDSRSEQIKEL